MRSATASLLLALLWSLQALAECATAGKGACFTNCRTTEIAPFSITSVADSACYEWDESASATTDDSTAINILTESAVFDFDPDRTTTGASTATVHVRRCTGGWPGSCDPNRCAPLTNSGTLPLSGAEGDAATQNKMMRVGPGLYCLDLVVLPTAGQDPIVEIRGETN